jgi:hypothetical protein
MFGRPKASEPVRCARKANPIWHRLWPSWPARGLRLTVTVVDAAGAPPGPRILVALGSSHAGHDDADLDPMHDWALTRVDAVLRD